jgi:hypothetical protein
MAELSAGTKRKSARSIGDTKERSKSADPLIPARLPDGKITAIEVEAVDALLVALGDLAGVVKFGGLVARLAADGMLIIAVSLPGRSFSVDATSGVVSLDCVPLTEIKK